MAASPAPELPQPENSDMVNNKQASKPAENSFWPSMGDST
jgi:hypothetical protein